MGKNARDPAFVAILLFSLLLVTLMLFLMTAVVRKKTAERAPLSFIPPGWVGPSSPPPSVK